QWLQHLAPWPRLLGWWHRGLQFVAPRQVYRVFQILLFWRLNSFHHQCFRTLPAIFFPLNNPCGTLKKLYTGTLTASVTLDKENVTLRQGKRHLKTRKTSP